MSKTDLSSEELKRLEEGHNLTAQANELWFEGRFADTLPLYEQALAITGEVLLTV